MGRKALPHALRSTDRMDEPDWGGAQPSPKVESPLGCYETQARPFPGNARERVAAPRQGRAPAARLAGFGGIPASYTRGMYRLPSVAAMMALMVCMRFSACSNWRPRSQQNTSSVTSMASMPCSSLRSAA